MNTFASQRHRMVERQVAARGVRDPLVLAAMREVPREMFVDDAMREYAYEDSPLPIDVQQTISQPYIVGLMIEAAQLGAGDRVLEIGAGSGYAAAVMGRIAQYVFAIERHAQLARLARRRLLLLGYDNIKVRTGDGSGGWPEAAPFDAIIASAGAPRVPDVLRRQLAIGGRLVMPVGDSERRQRLLKLVRTGQESWSQQELAEVLFVPLIGEHGWQEAGESPASAARASAGLEAERTEAIRSEPARARQARTEPAPPTPTSRPAAPARETGSVSLPALIAAAVEPLPAFDDPAFGRMFDRFADARVVLLGEASHGTSEFYRARASITRRLVEAHGFRIVAVEADWPDAAAVDRHVRHRPARAGATAPFQRFPTWMWRNAEVDAFVDWLRRHNDGLPAAQRTGFYGLDLYSLNSSIRAVIDYLDRVDPDAARMARQRYGCLAPWADEPAGYGHMALSEGYALCEAPVNEMLRELLDKQLEYSRHDGQQFLDASQNARLVQNAEAYYRAMYHGAADAWNLRDTHMFETLQHLLDAGGPDARAVVWAHNSHIGDARHTDMGRARGELNIGQLCREAFDAQAVLIGFGTHAGTVAAASDWDQPMQVMQVKPSRADSFERLFHEAGGHAPGVARSLLDLREDASGEGQRRQVRDALLPARLERFIGVIYRPDTERWSHYATASLPLQFDAWTWVDRTTAVSALPAGHGTGMPDTYPFGL
jgi:protein-L-isoaspartate(D-aspartate) O-methyltransferase